MNNDMSRRNLFAAFAAAAFAPLAGKLSAARGWWRLSRLDKAAPAEARNDGDCVTTIYTYDNEGNLISVIEPCGGEVTSFTYNIH